MRVWLIISLLVALAQSAPSVPKGQPKLHAPSSTQSTEDLMDSIEKIQNKFKLKSNEAPIKESPEKKEENEEREDRQRKTKMFNYFGYFNPQMAIPTAGIYPSVFPTMSNFYPVDAETLNSFYNYDFNNYYEGENNNYNNENEGENSNQEENNEVDNDNFDYEEEIFSRANRRRPGQGGASRNSPIFYIRLPPTPYMFVPGMGYISNPPTITPMSAPMPTPMPTMNPYLSNPYATIPTGNPYLQQPNPYLQQQNPYLQQANPFINLPLNFLSNGKPMNVYQFPSSNRPYQQPSVNPTRLPQNTYSTQAPNRPNRPYRPNKIPNYNHLDSKITTLKGPFLFNGRPEEIFLLQNLQSTPYSFPYSNPLQSFY